MLNKLTSDLSSFKSVTFHNGLNIILADKTDSSTDRQTRNGAGKSSLVELINTLLGSDIKKDSLVKSDALKEKSFSLNMTINSHAIEVSKSGEFPTKVFINKDDDNVVPLKSVENGRFVISNEQWTRFLGNQIFGIHNSYFEMKHSVSFRLLFSYFARSSKGFDSPDKTFPQQARWQSQVALTYLLKLNWKLVREFEAIRQKDKLIRALIQASNEGALKGIMGSAPELATEIHLKNEQLTSLKKAVEEFKVLPEYRQKEARANQITQELSALSSDDIADKELLSTLERTITEESEPDNSKVERLFKEASISFPEIVSKKFSEFVGFHSSIIANRRAHLAEEIQKIESRIASREIKKKELDDERSDILSLLKSHGALEQFYKLQGRLNKAEANIELLRQKQKATEKLNVQKTDVKIDKGVLKKKTLVDHSERSEAIRDAVVTFGQISEVLYAEPGRFTIEPTEDGPKFEFEIEGKKSTGKSKMQIFCFDMMMMKLWSSEKHRPKLLIHDSLLFDGVDERQVAKALYLGAEWAKKYDFQYVVTMNSDDLPDMASYDDFNIDDYLVDLKITDTENGGLFGVRF
ncbi:TPA: ABC-three component system protein [Vibrio metoecus]